MKITSEYEFSMRSSGTYHWSEDHGKCLELVVFCEEGIVLVWIAASETRRLPKGQVSFRTVVNGRSYDRCVEGIRTERGAVRMARKWLRGLIAKEGE